MEQKNRFDAFDIVLICLALAVFALVGVRTVSNPDVYAHLASGKQIVETGLKAADSLSYTAGENTWTNPYWLYDVLMYKIAGTNPSALTLLHVLMATLAFALLIPMTKKWSGAPSIALAITIAAWLIVPRFDVRPGIFLMIFPAIYILLLNSKLKPWLVMGILSALQILWANLGATHVLGIIIGLAYLAQAIRMKNYEGGEDSPVIPMAALSGTLVVASCITPYGPVLLAAGFKETLGFGSSYLPLWISSFNELFDSKLPAHIVNTSLFIGACGLIFLKNRLPLAATIIAVYGAFNVVLNIVSVEQFAVLAFPFLCLSLAATGRFLLDKFGAAAGLKIVGSVFAFILLMSTGTLIATNNVYLSIGHPSEFGLGNNHDVVSAKALEGIESNTELENIINFVTDGGYIAVTSDKIKVFFDQRIKLYDEEHVKEFSDAIGSVDLENWDAFEQKWNPEIILINCLSRESLFSIPRILSSKKWALAYMDGTSIVLAKPSKNNEALLKNIALKKEGLETIEQTRAAYTSKLGSFKCAPVPARLIGAASAFLQFNRFEEAYKLYSVLKAGVPNMDKVDLRLGMCELSLEKNQQAIQSLKTATENDPGDFSGWLYLYKAYESEGIEAKAQNALANARSINPEAAEEFLTKDKARRK